MKKEDLAPPPGPRTDEHAQGGIGGRQQVRGHLAPARDTATTSEPGDRDVRRAHSGRGIAASQIVRQPVLDCLERRCKESFRGHRREQRRPHHGSRRAGIERVSTSSRIAILAQRARAVTACVAPEMSSTAFRIGVRRKLFLGAGFHRTAGREYEGTNSDDSETDNLSPLSLNT